jgi:hypothetical protein
MSGRSRSLPGAPYKRVPHTSPLSACVGSFSNPRRCCATGAPSSSPSLGERDGPPNDSTLTNRELRPRRGQHISAQRFSAGKADERSPVPSGTAHARRQCPTHSRFSNECLVPHSSESIRPGVLVPLETWVLRCHPERSKIAQQSNAAEGPLRLQHPTGTPLIRTFRMSG